MWSEEQSRNTVKIFKNLFHSRHNRTENFKYWFLIFYILVIIITLITIILFTYFLVKYFVQRSSYDIFFSLYQRNNNTEKNIKWKCGLIKEIKDIFFFIVSNTQTPLFFTMLPTNSTPWFLLCCVTALHFKLMIAFKNKIQRKKLQLINN